MVPALPNTTAALRLSSRNFARFIGEPLKAVLNSSCDMASNSRASVRASLPTSAALGANDGSVSSRANLMFHGHTSWEMYRYTHFEIPLVTGARTLRRTTG